MAEERNTIALALRYSGAADRDEPSAEAAALVNAELEAMLDKLDGHVDRTTFVRILETPTGSSAEDAAYSTEELHGTGSPRVRT